MASRTPSRSFVRKASVRHRQQLQQRVRKSFFEQLETRSLMAVWTGGGAAGDWHDDDNWGGGAGAAPDMPGEFAEFYGTVAGTTINITTPINIDGVTFSGSATGFSIGGATSNVLGSVAHNSTGSNAISTSIEGSSSITLASGQLQLSGNNTLTGAITLNGGTLQALPGSAANPLGAAPIQLAGGKLDLDVNATTYTNALGHYGYHINSDVATLGLDQNHGMISLGDPSAYTGFEGLGLLTSGPAANRGLDFNNDAEFRSVPASILDDASGDGFVINQDDNYTNMWIGTFTPDISGNWGFRNQDNDDITSIWIDRDGDGVFESSPPGLGDNRGEQIAWESTANKSIPLVGGQSYLVAFTHREGGGGSTIDYRITRPGGSEMVIRPDNPAQANWWSFTNPTNVTLPNSLTVSADSVIDVAGNVTLGGLTFSNPALNLQINAAQPAGQLRSKLVFAGTTSIQGATEIDASANVTLTGAVSQGVAGSGLIKQGVGNLLLGSANSFTGDVIIAAGTIQMGNNASLGDETGKTVIQNGGTLDIRGNRAGANGNELVEVVGAGVDGWGAIVNRGVSQTNALRRVVLTGDTMVRADNRFDIRNNGGTASFNMNNFKLTKYGTAEFALINVGITNHGNIDVTQGIFRFEGSTDFDDLSTTVTVSASATLDFWNTNQTFDLNVDALAGGNITTNGGLGPTITGVVDLGGLVNFGINHNLTLSGQVTGAGGINKTGGATLSLTSNASDYTGSSSISAGTLRATTPAALGSPAQGTQVVSGGTLLLDATAGALNFLAEPLQLAGLGVSNAGALQKTGNSVLFPGAINLLGSTSIASNTASQLLTLSGNITREQHGTLHLVGAGNIDVTGSILEFDYELSPITARVFNGTQQDLANATIISNDINGTTTPTRTATLNGPLTFANAAAFNALFNTPSTIPLGDNFTTVFETTLTVYTAGDYTFSVTNNDDGAAVWLKPTSQANFVGTDRLQGIVANQNTAVAVKNLTPGTYTLVYAHREGAGGEAVTGRIQGPGLTGITTGTSLPIVNPSLFDDSQNHLVKLGTGTTTLAAANSYSGVTLVQEGTLIAAANNALGNVNPITAIVPVLGIVQQWQVGTDNGSNSEFSQENGSSNAAPGSATARDDDWYFAGTYPAPIGVVAANEALAGAPATGFERALTSGDPNRRIHFNLAPDQLDHDFQLVVDTISSSFNGGSIPVQTFFNGVLIDSRTIGADGTFTVNFNGATVNATTGDNVVEFVRATGAGTGDWLQFDFIRLNRQWVESAANTQVVAGATLGFSGVDYAALETINVSGGTVRAAAGDSTFAGPVQLQANSTLDAAAGASLNFTGVIADGGNGHGVNKTGDGEVILSADNTYTGPTTISSGLLTIDGSMTSNVQVQAAGTLGGVGTITGNVTGAGTVAPGNSPGILNVVGDFTPTGTVAFEVNPPAVTPGVDFDQITVTGNVDLSGATLTFSGLAGAVAPNQVLTILSKTSAGSVIPGATPAEGGTVTINGNNYRLFYNSGDGNDVVLVEATAAPVAYVDDAWAALVAGTIITDADLGATGDQPAVFGVTAFATINAALTSSATNGTIIVNDGVYAETVNLTGTRTLEITGPDAAQAVTIEDFASVAGTTLNIEGASVLTVGDADGRTIAGLITGTGDFTKVGTGVLTLSGSNASYDGDIAVNLGTLRVSNSNALGTSVGTTTLNFSTLTSGGNGVVLDLSGGVNVTSEALTMHTSNVGGSRRTSLNGISGSNTWGGSITVTGNDLAQFLSNGGGSNTLLLSGNITGSGFSGTTFFRGGSGQGRVTGVMTLGAGSFNRTDSATWTIASTGNTWTNTNIATGTLRLGADNALPVTAPLVLGQPSTTPTLDLNGFNQTVPSIGNTGSPGPHTVTSATPATFTINNAGNISFAGVFTGALNLTKTNVGNLTLTGASTYTGATAVENGTLTIGTNGSLLNTSGITVGSAGNTATLAITSTAAVALGAGNVTLGQGGGTGNYVQTGAAGTVSITGGIVDAGTSSVAITNGTTTVANGLATDALAIAVSSGATSVTGSLIVSGGAVSLGNGTGFLDIARNTNSTGASATGLLDLTAATSVTMNVGDIRLGTLTGNPGGSPTNGTLLLPTSAASVNTITATSILVGDSPGSANGGTSTFNLGGGNTTINTNTLTVSGQKSNATLLFGGPGTLLLRGAAGGASTANLLIGNNSTGGTGTHTTGTVDLSAGTFNGQLGSVVLGVHTGGGSGSGTGNLTMNAGTVTATSLRLGNGDTTTTTGNLNLNGGTFAVTGLVTNLNGAANITQNGGVFRFNTLTRATGAFTYTFNAGTIQNNPGVNLTNTNVNVNLNGGGLKSFEIDAGQTGTFQAASVVSGNGSLTKVGDGTLLLAGTNSYLGTTTVNDGTLQLQNGNAIANNAGGVTVGLGATLELLSSETVSSLVGVGDAVGSNDGLLALGSNTLTTVSSATIADVTSSAGGGIVAGTAIVDGDDDNNITGPNIYLQAATGIGSADPIETAVGAIQVNNTTSSDVQIANSNGGAALTISDLRTLGFGARNLGGALTITNASPLVVAANTSAVGAVLLTAGDSAAVGDDLTVNAGVLVESTGSSVTLNAGDDAFVTGNVTAATTVTVNVDEGNADAGVGGVLTITGVVTTPAVGGGAFLTGDVDDDEFNFAPQATTAFDVNGDLPSGTPTGDTLNLDITGATAASLTLGGIGAGQWSFTPATLRSVVYTSIEDVNANGQYHLVLDANATAFGNTGIDDYLTLRRSGTDFVLERTGNLNLPADAVGIVFTGDFATILSFTYLGSNDNDILTISDVGGLVDFAGTVPGVTDNGNLAGTAEFLFDGGAGSDRLVFDLTGASAAQSYAIGTGTTAGLEGEVSSTSGGTTLVSYFQDVELAQRTGIGATPGALTIIGDANANSFVTAANGALTRTSATGYTPFEFSGNNFSEITINALGGADSLDLESLGTGQTNSPAITLDGGDGNDTIRAQSTSGNTGDLDLIGGSGNDVFELYSNANTVDGLAGPVDVDGTDGNASGNLDRLVIIDSGDGSGDDVLIEAVDAATSEDYIITGLGPATSSVTFRSIDDLQYTGTAGNDTIDAQFVATTPLHDLNTVILAGFNGADQFLLFTSDQLGGTSPTPTPAPSGLSSITLLGGDGFDTFGATPTGLTDTGAMDVGLVVPDSTRMIRPSLSTAIIIDGGPPSVAMPTGDTIGDVLNLDISDLPDTLPVVVASGTVNIPGAPLAFAPLTWTDIEDLNLVDDGVLTNVQVGDLFGRMTDANDLVQFSRLNGVNQVRMRVNNWSGVYTVPGKTIVYGRGGIDHITQANLFNPAVFYGEDGNDVLTGASNNDWLVGGAGNDRISGAEGTNVLWGDDAPTSAVPEPQDVDGDNDGDDNLSAGLGNDVFYGGGGNDLVNAGGGNDYVHGGWGNDNLAGVAGDDRLYGGEGDDVLSGYLGNDLLSGGAGNDRLYGQTGNDVIIGGDGEDMLVGDTGNDLLITGIVANEHSTWSSQAPTSTFSAATYSDPGDNDTALLNLLLQWGSASNSSLLDSITHDGDDDDVAGYTGADDFCWEAADLLDQPGATTPSDFNAPSMGPDERFGPTI
jgi:autotransporter-associated beta strand protein